MTPTVGDVLSRLDSVRRTRRGWSARCPAHPDQSPSLTILEGRDGRVASIRCWAGCEIAEITHAIGIETTPRATPTRALRSTLALALDIARGQAWCREETRLRYQISDAIRHRRHAVAVARDAATRAGDREESWSLLATAAEVETKAEAIEAELEEVTT